MSQYAPPFSMLKVTRSRRPLPPPQPPSPPPLRVVHDARYHLSSPYCDHAATLPRKNGEKVVEVLEQTAGASVAVEKASIDEVYVDVTRAAKSLMNALVLSDLEGVDSRDSSPSPSRQKQQQQQQPQEKEEGKTCAGKGWEDIGAGGWARVVFEAAGTHVSMGARAPRLATVHRTNTDTRMVP